MAYEKQDWATGDKITAEKLNHIEDGISSNSSDAIIVIDATADDNTVVFKSVEDINTILTKTENTLIRVAGDDFSIIFSPKAFVPDTAALYSSFVIGEIRVLQIAAESGLQFPVVSTSVIVKQNAYIRADITNNKVYAKACDADTFTEVSVSDSHTLINLFEYGSLDADSLMPEYSGITVISFVSSTIGIDIVKCTNVSGKYKSTQPSHFYYFGPVLGWASESVFEQPQIIAGGYNWYVGLSEQETQ